MHVPNGGTVVTSAIRHGGNLPADATTSSDLLSFLAWGDNGSTANLPRRWPS